MSPTLSQLRKSGIQSADSNRISISNPHLRRRVPSKKFLPLSRFTAKVSKLNCKDVIRNPEMLLRALYIQKELPSKIHSTEDQQLYSKLHFDFNVVVKAKYNSIMAQLIGVNMGLLSREEGHMQAASNIIFSRVQQLAESGVSLMEPVVFKALLKLRSRMLREVF